MAKIEAWLSCDLKKPVQVQGLSGNVFSMDNNGSRINVRIYDNGEKTTVSGSVTANCILADGSTINVNGSLTTDNGQSVAYVDIPQSCLLVPGPIRIAIKLTASGVITTLAAVVTTVYRTQTDIVVTPSQQIITDWNAEISAAIATQNAAIANQDTKINDLKSALIDGVCEENLYESQGDYYLGLSGAITADSRYDCTVKIPVKKDNKFLVIGMTDSPSVSVCGFYNLGQQFTSLLNKNPYQMNVVTAPADGYLRCCSKKELSPIGLYKFTNTIDIERDIDVLDDKVSYINSFVDSVDDFYYVNIVKKIQLYNANQNKKYTLGYFVRDGQTINIQIFEWTNNNFGSVVCSYSSSSYDGSTTLILTGSGEEVAIVTVDWSVYSSISRVGMDYSRGGISYFAYDSLTLGLKNTVDRVNANLNPFISSVDDEYYVNIIKRIALYNVNLNKKYTVGVFSRSGSSLSIRIWEWVDNDFGDLVCEYVTSDYDGSSVVLLTGEIVTAVVTLDWTYASSVSRVAMNYSRGGINIDCYQQIPFYISKDYDITLPSTIYLTPNIPLRLYYYQISNVNNAAVEWIISGVSSITGYSVVPTDEYVQISCTGTINTSFVITGYINGYAVCSKTISVKSGSNTRSIKAIFLGDSFTAYGYYVGQLKYLLGDNLTLYGTLSETVEVSDGTSVTVNHEGRGGWSAVTYNTRSENNPFYNNGFDFAHYMSDNPSFEDVTDVFIMLGMNGGNASDLDVLIQSIHNYSSDIRIHTIIQPKIADCSITYGGGWKANLDTVNNAFQNVWKDELLLLNTDFIPAYINVNPWYDYPRVSSAVSSRNPATHEVINDVIHPNKYGFYNIADVIYSFIKANQ